VHNGGNKIIKSGAIKSVLLLACIGIIVISLVEPIAGHIKGQGNMTGQRDMMAVCPDNNGCPDNETHTMRCMMHCMMGDHPANGTMMHCMMGNNSANETIIHCMMGNHSANETMTHCMMCDYSANETMMHCMMGDHPTNGSCLIVKMNQNASSNQARLDCAHFWLEQAMKLHELHLKDPTTTTNESQIELMNQITRAYECIAEENVTSEMINTTTG